MTNKNDELLPCPFCGAVKLQGCGDDKYVGIYCHECGACGPNQYDSRFEWNTRTQPEAVDVDCCAACLWARDYPGGGSIYKTYQSTPSHDKKIIETKLEIF